MSRFGTNYQVARPTGACASTGERLEPGSACIATLCEREEDDGFDRKDFSVAAWDSGTRPERLFSFWRTVVPRPEAKRRLLVDDEVLEDLFERLAEDERPQRIAFRFVLGLILMRRRRLRFVGRSPRAGERDAAGGAESERWLVRRRGAREDEPPIEVINPRLGDEDVRELTAQLSEVLQGAFDE